MLAIIGPRDPENRVRDAILRRLVVGKLRRMIFKRFYAKLCKHVVRKAFWFITILKVGLGARKVGLGARNSPEMNLKLFSGPHPQEILEK